MLKGLLLKRTNFTYYILFQVCLRYLASGANFSTLEDIFRIPKCTLSTIVAETTEAIWDKIAPAYLQCPTTQEGWEEVARGFWHNW